MGFTVISLVCFQQLDSSPGVSINTLAIWNRAQGFWATNVKLSNKEIWTHHTFGELIHSSREIRRKAAACPRLIYFLLSQGQGVLLYRERNEDFLIGKEELLLGKEIFPSLEVNRSALGF